MEHIGNGLLTVTVNPRGGELTSLRGCDGVEYLWQADPAVWARHAPLLFPIVGRLANDRYSFNGQSYEMKQHGFVRDLDFTLSGHTDDRLIFTLQANETTLRQYPFEFILTRQYHLIEGMLEVTTEIKNSGNEVMPFSIGEHPGFSLQWEKGDTVEDYSLEFEREETLDAIRLNDQHLLSSRMDRIMTRNRVLALSHTLFNEDALIFLKVKSDTLSLCSRRQRQRLVIEFPGYPYLGIWAKPGAPFVCIEPWYGYSDTVGHDGDLMRKPGIQKLGQGQTFACVWRVRICP